MSSTILFEAENPFTLPNDNDIFHLPGEQLQIGDEKQKKKILKAHEKTTYISRMNATNTKIVKDINAAVAAEFAAQNLEKPPKEWNLGIAKDRVVEKEGMEDYIDKKRQMFFTRFLHRAKAAELQRLTDHAQAEKIQLQIQEKQASDKARAVDAFLKDMDKRSIGVLREAEDQTNRKLELQLEVRRLNAQIMAHLSEIQKHEDTLKEYQLYKRFLDSLAPKEWKEERRAAHQQRKEKGKQRKRKSKSGEEEKSVEEEANLEAGMGASEETGGKDETNAEGGNEMANNAISEANSKKATQSENETSAAAKNATANAAGAKTTSLFNGGNVNINAVIEVDEGGISSDSDDGGEVEEEEIHLYFTDPNQLLDMLGDLEEQNLSLIQNSQETEEALDSIKSNIQGRKDKMDEETETLKKQTDILEIAIQKEQERVRDLERKYAAITGSGEDGGGGGGGGSEAEREQRAVDKRVADIYKMCVGDEESNISTNQMLTNIEICMEELMCFMERTPKEKLDAAEKVKEQERKDQQKREALELGKRLAKERRKREIERANADVKPKRGKQLVFRSDPPPTKLKVASQRMKEMIQQEEELYYFFKW